MRPVRLRHILSLLFGLAVSTAHAGSNGSPHSYNALAAVRAPDGQISTDAARIKHVFIIVLENKDYSDTFGTSTQDPYLQKTLVPQGALLTEYYGTGHVSLDNYISLISGQAPTPDTVGDCPTYENVQQTGTADDGQVVAAHGCIYSSRIKTIADQLAAGGLSWKAYMEDMGNDPARETGTSCGHPVPNGPDTTAAFEAPSAAVPQGDGYASRHNPFVYFHSILDSSSCHTRDVRLEQLPVDLAAERTTPNLVFITPNLCNDGHDGSGDGTSLCKNGAVGGLASVDQFLQTWVPKILASQAYRDDGLLIITFDESNYAITTSTDSTGATTTNITFAGDACCHEQAGPNLDGVRPEVQVLAPGLNFVYGGIGGDRVGALLLSPFIRPGSNSDIPYNHYSMLRSLEDIFHLGYLGYAANDPKNDYFLNTIGNDEAIFQHNYDPVFEHRHEPWSFPWYKWFRDYAH